MTLEELFEANPPTRAWIEWEGLEVYMRKTKRCLPIDNSFTMVATYDVASVSIDEKRRGQGTFTRFLHLLEQQDRVIYVESVMNPRFQRFLCTYGFTAVRDEDLAPCYFKFPTPLASSDQ